MSHSQTSRRASTLFKSNTEAVSFLTKQNIAIKNNRSIKISYVDLTPYIHEQFGFIDPDFPHVHSSINQNQLTPFHSLQWIPAEQLTSNPNYSDNITTLDSALFFKKSINQALILINWFAKDIFNQIFLKQLSPFHLYSFDVMIDGVFVHMPIDSYVPVDPTTKKAVYTNNYNNSIFPCLYQKLMAKIYGDYYSINSEPIEIVELNTLFCRQEISMTQKKTEIDLQKLILKKLSDKSIVCFRTRNSIRLESFGLESNHIYIIIRLIQKEDQCLFQFLELEGSNWIGKYSKLRSDWLLEDPHFISTNKIVLSEEHKENYMSLKDMKGISRELIILNNTFEFHKNYYVCQSIDHCLSHYSFTIDKNNKVMLKTNFKRKKCYNSIMLFEKCTTVNSGLHYKLISTSFHQNKFSNYIQANLTPGEYIIVVYNTHPQEEVLPYNLTLFSSHTFLDIIPSNKYSDTISILENAFREYFAKSYPNATEPVLLKHLYHLTGMAFIYIKPNQFPIDVFLNLEMFIKSKIVGLNLNEGNQQIYTKNYKKGTTNILMFRCQWSKLQNIQFQYQKIEQKKQLQKLAFPPVGSTKIIQRKT